ncbi:sensor histidine kinase [Luteitalea sp. TBR-22]|uniref:sensor histidine kinase n=1 Tax=Luteitalea sp. TBR-22 TaxID=2802971 RepID=UPI001AF031F6|nr:ATP-binding protein [Luteitalea sp. TBR-22]BCS31146.1 sensor histidine kinase [Luteitalea sp. TBR-22]
MADPFTQPLAEALARVAILESVDDSGRAWLAERAEDRTFEAGQDIFVAGETAEWMAMMIAGEVHVLRPDTGEPFIFVHEGDVSGVLPYSRMVTLRATARAVQRSRAALLHKRHFPDLLRELPEVGERLVWMMADRIREQAVSETHREKLMALGKLSAGLAHELNNPAAAVQRAAAQLCTLLTELQESAAGEAPIGRHLCSTTAADPDPIERADHERALRQWSRAEGHDIPRDALAALADAGLGVAEVTELLAGVPREAIAGLVVRTTMAWRARALVTDIERATTRIADLVGAIKEYSYRDQAPVQTVDIKASLERTLTVFTPRLKHGVTIERAYEADLPPVEANAGEITQVWTNLIDNAVDAMQERGTLRVAARREGDAVVVEIGDSGPGIPPDRVRQIFEPFFTTKPMGEGTGLGLDIVRGIARRHKGGVRLLHSRPGDTVFEVRLPTGAAAREETDGDHVPAS